MRTDSQTPISTPTPTSTRAPGELRRAIRALPTPLLASGTAYRGRLVVPVIQAATTDKGARAHVIRPRRAGGMLRFYWPQAGGIVHRRWVNHPGNAPMRWWQSGLRRHAQPALRAAARRSWRR
jgi:hypothetical protein